MRKGYQETHIDLGGRSVSPDRQHIGLVLGDLDEEDHVAPSASELCWATQARKYLL